MKHFFISVVFFSLASLGLQSCHKEDNQPDQSQVINVDLKVNESFSFVLPKTNNENSFSLKQQASHFTLSELGKDASGNRVYLYTPALDYSGTDNVIVLNESDDDSNEGGHQGCGNDNDEESTITINFTIKQASDSGK